MATEPSPSAWRRRAISVGLLSFFLAVVVSYVSDVALTRVPAIIALLGVLFLITVGIAFDIVGTSVAAAESSPLHAMAAKKLHGSREAIWLVKNADRVANFCNDVIGDVTGAVSGAAGMTVAVQITTALRGGNLAVELTRLFMVGLIAFLTVGGKAAGKTYALEHPTDVVLMAGKVLHSVERVTGRSITGKRGSNSSRRRST